MSNLLLMSLVCDDENLLLMSLVCDDDNLLPTSIVCDDRNLQSVMTKIYCFRACLIRSLCLRLTLVGAEHDSRSEMTQIYAAA